MTQEEAIHFGNCILMVAAEKMYKDEDFDAQRTIDFTKTALEALKKHNDWVACVDELPKKQDMYLITWEGQLGSLKPQKWLDMLEFFPDEDGKEGEGWAVYDLEKQGFKNIQVIAWQDLPEVY